MTNSASEFFSVGGSNRSGYKQFVRNQVSGMNVDELKVVDLGVKDVAAFRMNLNQISGEIGFKFKTRVVGGKLYVGRID